MTYSFFKIKNDGVIDTYINISKKELIELLVQHYNSRKYNAVHHLNRAKQPISESSIFETFFTKSMDGDYELLIYVNNDSMLKQLYLSNLRDDCLKLINSRF